MNSLFFWIIVLSFLIPMAMRMYRKSVNKRNQDQSFSGRYPDQFPGGGQFPGQQSRQPRDGYTQQDYMGGGFRQINGPQPLPPAEPLPPMQPVPPMNQQFPPYGQQPYGQPAPGQPAEAPQPPAAPVTPPPPSAPLGFRARKLAELDQQYSNGEMPVDEYMKRRSEIMDG
ncbi:hypothetical protein [Arthrobacter sp. 754]|uniref:hypothetical protein n=1 Tax=Arthrobacter sp. 754 TaxID=3156315 RepID=UPI00339226F1